MPTAVITGASSGIGAAFARRLAATGADLVLLARDEARLTANAEQLRAKHGVQVEVLVADLATEEGIAAAERRVAHGVDLVVNNAGFGQRGTFLDTPVAEEVAMLRVHCEAVLRLTHAALPDMVARGGGGVINLSSVAAFFSRGSYAATKAWVLSFSESVAHDVAGNGVRVMALCPGWVRTEFHQRSNMDTGGIPGFMWLDADKLVSAGLRDYARGRSCSVPDARYKVVTGVSRLIPRRLSSALSARVGRRYE
jgi:hypothetical protein